jgi:hypothetical protein
MLVGKPASQKATEKFAQTCTQLPGTIIVTELGGYIEVIWPTKWLQVLL